MIIEHNSQSLLCRTPFGAAVCGKKVHLRILIGECDWPESVMLSYRFNGEDYKEHMYFHSVISDMNLYETVLTLPEKPGILFYFFEIHAGGECVYYSNNDARLGGIGKICDKDPLCYQITVYDKSYKTPDWFKGGVMYQIFPDRFYKSENYNGLDKARNIIKRNWGDTPFYTSEQFGGEYLSNDCFGGSLKGIAEKLDYLCDLGIDIIYLNPIFEANSNHKYNTANYEKIDPLFGDEQIFKDLCQKAKEKGIRIVLDGVFNHTGSDSIYFNKNSTYDSIGAYQSKNSPYYDWYNFSDYPDEYDCWWGIKTLPHVNENSKSYQNYILTGDDAIIKKWLRLGASGWRLDVVDELPDEFVKKLRYEAKKEKSDAVIIGEVWEDASNKVAYGELREYLCGFELDSAMNYPLRNAIISFSKAVTDAKEFNSAVMSLKENYPPQAFYAMMNFLSSHDTQRIITKLSDLPDGDSLSRSEQAKLFLNDEQRTEALKRLYLALFLQFTLPGVCCIYYGDEIGMEGYSDPFCRKCYPWDKDKDENLKAFYKKLIALKKSSKAFISGELIFVYGEGSATGFIRKHEGEVYLCILNTSPSYPWHLSLELGRFLISSLSNIENSDENYECGFGRFNINLNPQSFKVFKCGVNL